MNKHRKQVIGLVLSALVLVGAAVKASAITYGFDRITANGNVDVADQLMLDVLEYNDSVLFYLQNLGPVGCSITDVYIDDGVNRVLLNLVAIDNSDPGVAFTQGATPRDLPGGNNATPTFTVTQSLSADADPPPGGAFTGNGVNPGEYLGLIFSYAAGVDYADVIADLDSGDLRVGLHMQSIGDTGGSDSYVTDGRTEPPTPVPDRGATILLMGIALLGVEFLRRRAKARVKATN